MLGGGGATGESMVYCVARWCISWVMFQVSGHFLEHLIKHKSKSSKQYCIKASLFLAIHGSNHQICGALNSLPHEDADNVPYFTYGIYHHVI